MQIALLLSLIATIAVQAAQPATVVVFGDSITAGGALPAAERAQLWVSTLEKASDGRLKLVNEGKGGRPSASVKEFEAMLSRQPHAEILVLALGMNDSRDITPQCVPKAVANLRAMVALARKTFGERLKVLFVGPTNICKDALVATKPIAEQRAAKLRELGAGFEALAKDLNVRFTSLYGVVPKASLGKDGVHPDGAGNAPIAKALLPVLLDLAGSK